MTIAAIQGVRLRSVFRSSVLVVGGYAAVATVGMVALRLYTELAPAAVFGRANLLLTMLPLGMQLFVAPFTNTQLRYHTEAHSRGTADAFTQQAFVWALRGATGLAGVSFIACLYCGRFGGPELGATVAATTAAWVFAMTFRNVLLSQLQAERRRLSYSALTVFEAVVLAVLTAIALNIEPSVESFLLGQVLGIVCLVILTLLTNRRLFPTQSTPEAQRAEFREKAFSYGLPFAPLAVGGWLANLADRYVLGFQLGAAAVGQYVAPLSIASRALILVNGALNDLFRPALFDAENSRQRTDANKVFASWIAVNICVGIAAVTAVAVLGEWVVDVFLAQSYRAGAVQIMLWIASGYSIYGLTQVLETRILSLGKSARLVAPMAAGAVANIGFSWMLVSRHGILGAAQASCLSFAVQSLVTAFFLRSALRQRRAAT